MLVVCELFSGGWSFLRRMSLKELISFNNKSVNSAFKVKRMTIGEEIKYQISCTDHLERCHHNKIMIGISNLLNLCGCSARIFNLTKNVYKKTNVCVTMNEPLLIEFLRNLINYCEIEEISKLIDCLSANKFRVYECRKRLKKASSSEDQKSYFAVSGNKKVWGYSEQRTRCFETHIVIESLYEYCKKCGVEVDLGSIFYGEVVC